MKKFFKEHKKATIGIVVLIFILAGITNGAKNKTNQTNTSTQTAQSTTEETTTQTEQQPLTKEQEFAKFQDSTDKMFDKIVYAYIQEVPTTKYTVVENGMWSVENKIGAVTFEYNSNKKNRTIKVIFRKEANDPKIHIVKITINGIEKHVEEFPKDFFDKEQAEWEAKGLNKIVYAEDKANE